MGPEELKLVENDRATLLYKLLQYLHRLYTSSRHSILYIFKFRKF